MRDQCYRRGWPHGEEQDGDNPCVCGEKAFHRGLHVCDDCGAKWAGGRAPGSGDPLPDRAESSAYQAGASGTENQPNGSSDDR